MATTPAESGQPLAQQLTLVERATSRWIASSTPRHPITLGVCTLAILVADLVGANIDRRAYAAMGIWVVQAWFAGLWCAAHPDFAVRLNRYAWGVIGDVLFLAVVFAFLDGAQTIGVSFFALMVVAASSVLPRRWALIIGLVAWLSFVALIAFDVYGPRDISSPLGLPPVSGNNSYFLATTVAAAVLIYLLLRTYAQVMSAMAEAETRHQAVIRTAADAILIFDGDGHIVEVNPAVLQHTGYTWVELKAMPNRQLFYAEDWPTAWDAFVKTLAGESTQFESRIVLKSGEVRWAEIWTSTIPIEGRNGVVALARDVTVRHRTEEQLRENDAKLTLVLDALNSGFYTIDRDLNVTSVRGKGSETASKLVGRSVLSIAPSAEEAVIQREQHMRALDGNIVTWVWPVGSGRWVRSHVAPVRNSAGEVTGAAGFWRDESSIMRSRDEEDARWSRFRTSGQTRGIPERDS
jgi:PAS domain S-box-containing protein